MAPHSSTLAWKIPWMVEPGGLQSMRSLESDTIERLHFQFSLSCIGEGNGNPLKCSCLENPRDGGAWWATICGVAQSRTWLKQLSSSSRSSTERIWVSTNILMWTLGCHLPFTLCGHLHRQCKSKTAGTSAQITLAPTSQSSWNFTAKLL